MSFLYKMEKLEELLAQRISECYYFLAEPEFFFRGQAISNKSINSILNTFFFP